jgi:hypothetical protein
MHVQRGYDGGWLVAETRHGRWRQVSPVFRYASLARHWLRLRERRDERRRREDRHRHHVDIMLGRVYLAGMGDLEC